MRPQKLVFSVLDWTHVEARAWCGLPKITTPTPTVMFRVLRAIRMNTPCRFLVKFKWKWG